MQPNRSMAGWTIVRNTSWFHSSEPNSNTNAVEAARLLRGEHRVGSHVAFPALDTRYDEFLYAIIGRERNGMELTMASAIARSGADPWQEAARIASLPKEMALQILARLLPAQLDAADPVANGQTTMERLFSLLPQQPPQRAIGKIKVGNNRSMHMAVVLTFCAAAVVILAHFAATAPHPDAGTSTGVPAVSTPAAVVR